MSRQPFKEHVVWITGGGTGLGREMALEFARRGADVVVSGRRVERLQEVVAELGAIGGRPMALACDVTDEEDCVRAVEQIVQEYGRLDVAVANAGYAVAGPIERITADEWRRQLETNVIGLTNTVRAALPELRKTRGRLALTGSVSGFITMPNVGPYHASKFAVRAIGQTLAKELHGSGVTCTTLHPGFVESEIAQVDNSGVHRPERQDRRPHRLMWKTPAAARVMVDAIQRRKREYVFTGHGRAAAFLGKHFPGLVHFVITRAGANYKRGV